MACNNITLKGMSAGCRDNIGGILKAYITDASNVTSVAVSDVSATTNPNTVTGITMANTAATWYSYEFRKGTSDMQSNVTLDDALGTFAVETTLNLQFSNASSYKLTQAEALCKKDTVALVKDAKGRWFYLGETLPLAPTSATYNSGKASADGSLINIALATTDDHFPHAVLDSVIATLTLEDPTAEG